MDDGDDLRFSIGGFGASKKAGGMADILRLSDHRRRRSRVYFNRYELSQLLALYSGRVSRGEWRDYAIDNTVGLAVFSVFRHTHDRPLYAIAKVTGSRGPEYMVFDTTRRLARDSSLAGLLDIFNRDLRLVGD